MVNPLYIVAILLGTGFLLPLISKAGRRISLTVFFMSLISVSAISYQWLWSFLFGGQTAAMFYTAGVEPPLSINFLIGYKEAIFLTAVNFMGLVGAIYMSTQIKETGYKAMVLFLLMVLGLNGLILTADIFNLFVFMEITSIATFSLVGMDLKLNSLTGGFKYMIAGGLASVFLLLGIIILYSLTGTLGIESMSQYVLNVDNIKLLSIGSFLLIFSFIIEMKQFPANGWAIDVYDGANPGITGLASATGTAAVFYSLYKIMPIVSDEILSIIIFTGSLTFIASNLMGLMQTNPRRMLGYSSVAQMGLVMAAAAWSVFSQNDGIFFTSVLPLLLNHFFAKAGLFWISGIIKKNDYRNWGVIRENKVLSGIFIVMVLALTGMPPFPGFWGKWNLVLDLAANYEFFWIFIILLGSLFEAGYMLRWLGVTLKKTSEKDIIAYDSYKVLAIEIINITLLAVSFFYFFRQNQGHLSYYLPYTAGLALLGLRSLPERFKGVLALTSIFFYGYMFLPLQTGFVFFFNAMFIFGAFVLTIATLNRKKRSSTFYGLLMLMTGSLIAIANADNILHFFISWEIMTVTSYLLIRRGNESEKESYSYIMFSLGGAFLILSGFAYAYSQNPEFLSFNILSMAQESSAAAFILISLGFLIKSAALGVHIWIAGAYSKAEDDVTPFISALLSKAGIFGFVMLLLTMGIPKTEYIDLAYILSWVGALTALIGTMMAIHEENAKRLLAYSSMGQVGYIILALSIMSGLGWTAAMFQMINHFLIKGVLFLAIAGVIYRTGTADMYKMGGLIKKMPWSFTAVMFGIIAISGVPPLTGFGAKWLLYEALIEKGWYLQTGAAFFASTVAFLYCFRLIHAIFLGQPKNEFRNVKEAPAWFIVPQYIFIMVIFLFSVFPKLLIDQITGIVDPIFGSGLTWQGGTAITSLGYWNGTTVMTIVGVIFVVLAAGLFIKSPKVQKVKQFNIVFSAERPETPELTHFAYEFFRPYRRALGWMIAPYAKNFWAAVTEWTLTISDSLRKIYTGNTQTYIFYILMMSVVLFYVTVGVK